jgi:hemolysin activation/secretion protein
MMSIRSCIVTLSASAITSVPVAFAADAARAAPAQHFTVSEYRVLGNTVLAPLDIETVLYPLLGEEKMIDDVERARTTLETYYHERGYGTVFVDIPEQDVNEGVVRLRVTQGRLERTRIAGARYFSGRAIRNALPEATRDGVPNLPVLQQQLAALNGATPDRVVTPVLKAGSRPGTVQLTLNVEDELPAHVSVGLNDQYTTDTSKLRASAAVSYDNLFGRLDSLSLQYQTAPQEPDEVSVWAASYTARLTDAGTRLAFYAIDSDSQVATVGDGGSAINVLGAGRVYGLRLVSPLEASAAASHLFIAGLEYKDFTESVFSSELVLTPITYTNLSLGHVSAWRHERQQWSLATTGNLGVRGAGNDPDEFRAKRRGGVPNYFFLRTDASYATRLPWDLQLRVRGAGQYAIDSIISNEQFSIAGADGVRGYLEAEQLGDVGIKSSLELGSPTWHLWTDRLQTDLFAFFDYGRATHLNPLREQDPRTLARGELLEVPNRTLRSVGVGLHLSAFGHVDGSLIWAYPLIDGSDANGTQEGDSRIHFNVRASW